MRLFSRPGIHVCRFLMTCGLFVFFICYILGEGVALKVDCEHGWQQSRQSGTCIRVFLIEKLWKEARQHCQKSGSDLVKILDSKMNTFVSGLANTASNFAKSTFFIGLLKPAYTETYSWLNDTSEANYMGNTRLVSSSHFKEQVYAHLYLQHNRNFWSTEYYDKSNPYICEKIPGKRTLRYTVSTVKLCAKDWYPNPHAGTCINVIRQHMSWFKARVHCQTLGGDLAVILDREVDQFLSDQTVTIGWRFSKSVWIGLNDVGTRGNFKWLDNIVDGVNYANWKGNQPDSQSESNCVKLNQSETSKTPFWDDTDCNENLPFICERFSDCKYEKYGMFCPKSCTSALCADDEAACNRRNGICQNGCDNRTYGVGCLKTCNSHCEGPDKACYFRNGSCVSGCEDGYKGHRCETAIRRSRPKYTTAAIVSAAIFASVVFLACFLLRTVIKRTENEVQEMSTVGEQQYMRQDKNTVLKE